MSTQETSLPIELSAVGNTVAAPTFWRRLGSKIEWAGERLNPLLVKEVRQSLKSRQFSMTFTAVLCLSWLWSIAGIVRLGPQAAYGAFGPDMFLGYYVILAFPLILIVPYSTFRSLIAEREDNTFELVAITTLQSRQMVAGKLGSSVAQMAVYFSAVAPCLAFTYLLRGIDIPTICWILFYTFLASLGFSLFALLLASVGKEKHWQVLLAVVIVVGLFCAFVGAVRMCEDRLHSSRLQFTSSNFWVVNFIFLSAYLSTFALLFLAATAQLTFTSENRSSPLRWAMLAQQTVFLYWVGYGEFVNYNTNHSRVAEEVGFVGVISVLAATIYWFMMGSLMIGEATELSPRVKRRLPRSGLGRALFTWFNPGTGTGYLFAISNVTAVAILALLAVWYGAAHSSAPPGSPTSARYVVNILLLLGYLIIYLGVGNLLVRLLRRFTAATLSLGFVVNVLLVMAGCGIPAIIDPYDMERSTYNLGHLTDPIWSCFATIGPQTFNARTELIPIILPAAALVFLINLVYIVPEIRQFRITPPARVIEENQALATQQKVASQATSPWG
jgi:hypothetical protein